MSDDAEGLLFGWAYGPGKSTVGRHLSDIWIVLIDSDAEINPGRRRYPLIFDVEGERVSPTRDDGTQGSC